MTPLVPDADVYRRTTGQADVATWWDERLRESSLDHRRQIVPTAAGPTHLLESGQGRLTVAFPPEPTRTPPRPCRC